MEQTATPECRVEYVQIRSWQRRQRRKPGLGNICVHSRSRRHDSPLIYRTSVVGPRYQGTRYRRVDSDLECHGSHTTGQGYLLYEGRILAISYEPVLASSDAHSIVLANFY